MRSSIFIFCSMLVGLGGCNYRDSTPGTKDKQVSAALTECSPSFALNADLEDYDFVFPTGLSEYTEGTRVFNPKTGRVYQCKDYPYSKYCKQWSTNAARFEPGSGSNWMAAWDLQ